MPSAVTHVLIAIIALDLVRHYAMNKKQRLKFPLHYLLIIGIAALLPDLDIAVYWILKLTSGMTLTQVHRTFTHTLFFPAVFAIAGIFTIGIHSKKLNKHRLKLSTIFFVVSIGIFSHLLLDFSLSGVIMPFYPLSTMALGLNLVQLTPWPDTVLPALDAILLIGWLIHEEIKHKISDFI